MALSKPKFRDRVKTGVAPMVLGGEDFAFKLQTLFMHDEVFDVLDPSSMLENVYTPNLIIVFGPSRPALIERVLEIKREHPRADVLYIENLSAPEDEEQALRTAEKIGAGQVLAKKFVTLENIKDAVKEASNA